MLLDIRESFSVPPPPLPIPTVVQRSGGRTLGILALIFSILAVGLSGFAAFWIYFYEPLGNRLEKYDFSSPEAAARSKLKIESEKDLRAKFELIMIQDEKLVSEKQETFTVHKTKTLDTAHLVQEADDKEYDRKWKVLFVSYQRRGKKIYECQFYRRHKDLGLWFETFKLRDGYMKSRYIQDAELRESIDKWDAKTEKSLAAKSKSKTQDEPVEPKKSEPNHEKAKNSKPTDNHKTSENTNGESKTDSAAKIKVAVKTGKRKVPDPR